MKTVLVTGATGFCGRHMCPYLAQKGFAVTGTFIPHPHAAQLDCPVVPLNIVDPAAVSALIRKMRPDFLAHLAAQTIPRYSWEHQEETVHINVAGTMHLLEALRQYSPSTRMLYVSTNHVYGGAFRNHRMVSENAVLMPENPYAGSKALGEMACLNYVSRFGLRVVIARAFNHLGRGQAQDFVFADWCRQIARAEAGEVSPVLEVGNLKLKREFLHVDDVVAAYELLLRKGVPGKAYNICTGRPVPLERYLRFLLDHSSLKFNVIVQKKRFRRDDPPVIRGSADRMRSLGWSAVRSVYDALEDLLEDWRSRVKGS